MIVNDCQHLKKSASKRRHKYSKRNRLKTTWISRVCTGRRKVKKKKKKEKIIIIVIRHIRICSIYEITIGHCQIENGLVDIFYPKIILKTESKTKKNFPKLKDVIVEI